jgi:hypothetical protein
MGVKSKCSFFLGFPSGSLKNAMLGSRDLGVHNFFISHPNQKLFKGKLVTFFNDV